jgi:hypothetical protein
MTGTRYRSAWVLLAVAVMAVATATRADATGSTSYAHPVLEFLAGHHNAGALTGHGGAPQRGNNWSLSWSAKQTRAEMQSAGSGVWQAMLPVLFIGLLAPLNLAFSRFRQVLCRAPQAPALPFSFQRPPPTYLA